MFFEITKKEHKRNGFCSYHEFDNFIISCDGGWSHAQIDNRWVLFKGYTDDLKLSDTISSVMMDDVCGNYCVIAVDEHEQISISTNKYRSFPLKYNENTITNFDITRIDGKDAFSDSNITSDSNLVVSERVFDAVGNCDLDYSLTESEILSNMDELLYDKVSSFIHHNDLPLKIILSGGLDSMLIYSYIKRITDDYELLSYQHVDYDKFWCNHGNSIKNSNWSYNQLHHWLDKSMLVSGAPGDEFMMRNPMIFNVLLNHRGVNITEYFDGRDNYHSKFIERESYVDKMNKQTASLSDLQSKASNEIVYYLCNILSNDYQHHHLGETLTFTPLRDIKLVKMFMQLPTESLIGQATNGDITRALISKNDPKLLHYISPYKNCGECMANVSNLVLGIET